MEEPPEPVPSYILDRDGITLEEKKCSRILRRQYSMPLTNQKSLGFAHGYFHKDHPDCQGGCNSFGSLILDGW